MRNLSEAEQDRRRDEKRDYKRLWAARKRANNQAKGLCWQCGKAAPAQGHTYCERCLADLRAASRRLRERRLARHQCRRCHGPHDKASGICEVCLHAEQEKRAKRLESKLCVRCGKPAVEGLIHCRPCADDRNRLAAAKKERLKVEVFNRYGGCRCACCGETIMVFLTIDHIDGGGNKHRAELDGRIGGGSGQRFYAWLKRHNFPPGYQVLCFNCNFAKWKLGKCPHHDGG